MACWIVYRHVACLLTIPAVLAISADPAQAQAQADRPSAGETTSAQAQPAPASPSEEAQGAPQASSSAPETCGASHLRRCVKDILHDQAGIWTSPLRMRPRDALWLAPFAGATAVALHYDAQAQMELGVNQSRINVSSKISDFGSPLTTFGEGAALYLVGTLTRREHLAETGRLGAEAVIDASLLVEGIKLPTNRERPDKGDGLGGFWPHGAREYTINSSFPSGHAAASWAFAHVVAAQYPSIWTRLGVYSFAAAISVSRVTQRKHFPSDVLVGGTFGYLVGGYVVRHHTAERLESSSSFAPIVDPATRSYGLRLDLCPDDLGRVAARFAQSAR